MKKNKLLYTTNEWSYQLLDETWDAVLEAAASYGLDIPKIQFELVTYEQMLDIGCSHALPNLYNHWSFGKQFIQDYTDYDARKSNLAYEVIINTDPSLCYIMENNTMTHQVTVMCHAAIGHANFFKNNYLFRQHTDPKVILSFLEKSKDFIEDCEKKYGTLEVESLIDSCHALFGFSFDAFNEKPWTKKQLKEREKLRLKKEEEAETEFSVHHRKIRSKPKIKHYNLLKYIRDNSKHLKKWQKNIITMFLYISQYLYPQTRTKIMNEGWASFWHFTLMTDLYNAGKLSDGNFIEFLEMHSNVLYQHDGFLPNGAFLINNPINPYKLGFEMFKDLKRICQQPTAEDREWFPDIVDTEWVDTLKNIAFNYRDDSFVQQFLSPNLIRKLGLFSVQDNEEDPHLLISSLHNEDGYRQIREDLSEQVNFDSKQPVIYIVENYKRDGVKEGYLYVENFEHAGRELSAKETHDTLMHVHILWGADVVLGIRRPLPSGGTELEIMEW